MATPRRKQRGRRQQVQALLAESLQKVRLFATDVDGVLTDGGMYYSESGDELKKFNTRDGMGIKLLQEAGLVTALVTKEKTAIVERRGAKLGIPEVYQGVEDKVAVLSDLAEKYRLTMSDIAYIGDDVNDLGALKAVGFSAAPADALPSVLKAAKYICSKKGGEGAVREVAEMILAAKGRAQS